MRLFLAFLLSTLPIFSFAKTINGIEIHPAMVESIEKNENAIRQTGRMKAFDYVTINGKKHFTGFNPTSEFYSQVKVIRVKADYDLIEKWKAKGGLDYRKESFSPVRGQIWGSCWAEAAGSTHELNYNRKYKTKKVFAVQDYIDCSGFGTARSGGQIALPYGLKGIALDSDYKYHGKDGQCKRDVKRQDPFQDVAVIRGENGGFPTEPELLTAFFTYGAMEVCGSAGALSSGGRQDTIRSGYTNHCYSYASAIPGKLLGWLDVWYHGMKNSWGDGIMSIWNLVRGNWGVGGWGDYRISTDGSKISGSVITEVMTGYFGEYSPAEPVQLHMQAAKNKTDFKVNVPVQSKFDAEKIRKALIKAGYQEVSK